MPEPVILDHPLIHHHLAHLRDRATRPAAFREHLRMLAALLAVEATRDLPTTPCRVTTPIQETPARRVTADIALVPILRAGLALVDPLLALLPEARVLHLGYYRDETTHAPVAYYERLPTRPAEFALVLDPMLATGGSAAAALRAVADWGAGTVKLLSILAAPEGLARITREFPAVAVTACALDERLNDQAFIVPGLGDAGDRMFHTEGG